MHRYFRKSSLDELSYVLFQLENEKLKDELFNSNQQIEFLSKQVEEKNQKLVELSQKSQAKSSERRQSGIVTYKLLIFNA